MDTDAHFPLTEGHGPPAENETTSSPTPTAELTSIVCIMRDMMVDQRRQDKERVEKRCRYEEESERRIQAMNKQMEMLE